MNRSVTLRDVAAHAGVAPQTVSNFINGRHRTRAATRERIQLAIRELRYEPNASARALRSRRVRAIALLLEDPNELGLHDPLHMEFLHGAATAAHQVGYHLTLALTEPGQTEEEALRIVRERRADGLVISFGTLEGARLKRIRPLIAEGLPIVLLQERATLPGVFTVAAQDEAGAAHAVEHLVELGHRRLAFLSGEPLWPGPERRRDGTFAAAEAAGAQIELWTCESYTVEAARARVAGALRARDAPTALLAANDMIALGAIQQAIHDGLSVPGDVSVVGFNDFDFASWVRPAITTVRLPSVEMGRRAVSLLVSAAENQKAAESVTFQVELVVRDSTGPAPAQAASQPAAAAALPAVG